MLSYVDTSSRGLGKTWRVCEKVAEGNDRVLIVFDQVRKKRILREYQGTGIMEHQVYTITEIRTGLHKGRFTTIPEFFIDDADQVLSTALGIPITGITINIDEKNPSKMVFEKFEFTKNGQEKK